MVNKVIWIIIAVVTVLGTSLTQVALAQDPRPPIDTRGGDGGGDDKGNGDDHKQPKITCGAVMGQIINWGYKPEPGIDAVLNTWSWQVAATTDTDGNYRFGGLGIGLAYLNVSLAPGDPLRPVTENAVVHLTCDYPTYANLGITSSPQIDPPVTLEMSASSSVVSWDDSTKITLTVENNLPTGISNVIITDLMPPGLTALAVSTTAEVPTENTRIMDGGDDGQLVVAYLDKMAAGTVEKVTITVRAIEDTPYTQMKNTATLFYRESVAVQDSLDFTVRRGVVAPPAASVAALAGPTSVPKTEKMTGGQPVARAQTTPAPTLKPTTTPPAAPTALATPTAARKATAMATPVARADTAAEETSQPDSLLPTTGDTVAADAALSEENGEAGSRPSTGTAGSVSGLSLVGLAFVAYALKSLYQRRPLD